MPPTDRVKPVARAAPEEERERMSTPDIPSRHSDDARADSAAPTDAVTDEVREDAAEAEEHVDLDDHTGDTLEGDAAPADDPGFPAAEGHA
ncbi:hypothetical protein MTE01_01280 [Microbacterium testaceum]|uniref:Uncharacterized protein n=2 Tax=Microbacterium testaceum TaxID=2033 RepID=A0A4Y3QHN3_MICTE|nr:hypothetical protein MTE01_01280 [Microbacterium testaceum]